MLRDNGRVLAMVRCPSYIPDYVPKGPKFSGAQGK